MKGTQPADANSAAPSVQTEDQTVAELPSAQAETAPVKRYDALATLLSQCDDTSLLFKIAATPDFKAAASTLPPAELKKLRELYVSRKDDLDGKTKLENFDGQIINITDIRFWHTDKTFGNPNFDGNGVTLTYSPESDPRRVCRSMTSSSIVYRFATKACTPTPPTLSNPVRAHIELVPVKDEKRAAEGQKQWQFRLMPTLTRDNGEAGSPF